MLNNTERLKLIISKFEISSIFRQNRKDALLPANYEEKKSS